MTYVTEQTSAELRAHMRRLQAIPGWHNPLDDRLFKEIQALDAEIAALRSTPPTAITAEEAGREGDGWLPIETAPKDGTYILLSCDGGIGSWVGRFQQFAVSGYKFEDPWRTMMLNHNHMPRATRYHAPTHWQPLPSAPAQSGGQG